MTHSLRRRLDVVKRILFRAGLGATLVRRPLYRSLRVGQLTRTELEADGACAARYFGSEEEFTLPASLTLGDFPVELQEQFGSSKAFHSRPFVAEIPDAELCGPRAVGFDSRRRVILETTPPVYDSATHVSANVTLAAFRESRRIRSNAPSVDVALSLVNEWGGNYWHWLVDALTRLEGLEHYAQVTGIRPKLIVSARLSKMQRDSLAFLGYGPDDCIPWNKKRLKVKKLVISPFRREYRQGTYGILSPNAVRWLASRLQAAVPKEADQQSTHIYISRSVAGARRVVNEEALVEALRPLGYQSYHLENLSLAEQVRLFSSARTIVAPHGAGLTNMMFGRDLSVIELFGSVCPRCYSVQARALGFRYGFLRSAVRAGDLRGQDADFTVDVPQVLELIRVVETSK